MLSLMLYAATRQRSSLARRALGVLVVACLLVAPAMSMAMDLHELSHGVQHLQAGHEVADPDHGEDQDGLHSVLHGVHMCGHGVGIPPSLVTLTITGGSVPLLAQPDPRRPSAASSLLFRPPRQN
jgi:hypothetical protein